MLLSGMLYLDFKVSLIVKVVVVEQPLLRKTEMEQKNTWDVVRGNRRMSITIPFIGINVVVSICGHMP